MNRSILTLSILIITLAPAAAKAESGRTADGCTYRILNGQYLTDCSNKLAKPAPSAAGLTSPTALPIEEQGSIGGQNNQFNEPVGSYGDVPVRSNPYAAVPSVETEPAPVAKKPETIRVPLRPAPGPKAAAAAPAAYDSNEAPTALQSYESTLRDFEESRRRSRIDRIVERPYAGISAGATNISSATSGTAPALGLTVGTLLDEYFGVELGYNYARQGLNLGLPNRSGGTLASYGEDDASLRSHLVTVELQGYVTNALRRFRPFLGLGLGFRSATLRSIPDPTLGLYDGPATLSQTSFGGSASAGAKLRVGKRVEIAATFRYFFPFARQAARLEQEGSYYGVPGDTSTSALRLEDDELTGSSQYQIAGGLLYAF